jgi:hypothetical protein
MHSGVDGEVLEVPPREIRAYLQREGKDSDRERCSGRGSTVGVRALVLAYVGSVLSLAMVRRLKL